MNYKYILTTILVMAVFSGTASAWLTGYDHRMAITVNNGGASNLSYYQFNFTNDTNVLVAEGNMQASGADCRITDASDNLLPFWNETPFNAAGTKIWVNATTLAVGDNTFYMYYGNAGASSVSNITNTFLFGDDFNEGLQDTPVNFSTIVSSDVQELQSTDNICLHVQYYNGRTYLVYATPETAINITYFDHTTKEWSTPVTVVTDFYDGDPGYPGHGGPALVLTSDHHIIVFYGCHDYMRYKISTNPEDISSWGSEKNTTFGYATYPNPVMLSNGNIWLFAMHAGIHDEGRVGYIVSTDGGQTWSSPTLVTQFDKSNYWPYFASPQVGSDDSVHLAITTFDKTGSVDCRRNVYYMKYDPIDSRWEKYDGTEISIPATHPDNLTLVAETPACTNESISLLWDIKLDSNNTPYFLYSPGDSYQLAKYEAGNWHNYTIVSGGRDHTWDIGRLKIENDTTFYAYVQRYGVGTPQDLGIIPGSHGRGGNIQLYKSTDAGTSWAFVKNITNDNIPNIDPNLVVDGTDLVQLVWHRGTEPCDFVYYGNESGGTMKEMPYWDNPSSSGNFSITSGILRLSVSSMVANVLYESVKSKTAFLTANKVITTKMRPHHRDSTNHDDEEHFDIEHPDNSSSNHRIAFTDSSSSSVGWGLAENIAQPSTTAQGSGYSYAWGPETYQDTWVIVKQAINASKVAKVYFDGAQKNTGNEPTLDFDTFCVVLLQSRYGATGTEAHCDYDYTFVRNYTSPEPVATLGAEETGGGGCGAYNITLPFGWSIIGWTNPTASTAHAVGTSIGGNCLYVLKYNDTTGQYIDHNMLGPEDEDNFAIERGWGYWVKTSAETLWERDS